MRRSILLPLLVSACAAPQRGDVKIIGHGGMGTEADMPINSREALLGGMEAGLDGIELDVQMTADSVLVAYHDATLQATTTCSGRVNDHTWDELRFCPAMFEGRAYPLVRVDSLLLHIAQQHPNVEYAFDIKLDTGGDWWGYLHAFADALVNLDQQPFINGRFLVECQVTDFIDLIELKQPSIDTYYYATQFEGAIDTALVHGCTGITMDDCRIGAPQVAKAHARGLRVTIFGVAGTNDHVRALAKHPDRIQTDAPSDFSR